MYDFELNIKMIIKLIFIPGIIDSMKAINDFIVISRPSLWSMLWYHNCLLITNFRVKDHIKSV